MGTSPARCGRLTGDLFHCMIAAAHRCGKRLCWSTDSRRGGGSAERQQQGCEPLSTFAIFACENRTLAPPCPQRPAGTRNYTAWVTPRDFSGAGLPAGQHRSGYPLRRQNTDASRATSTRMPAQGCSVKAESRSRDDVAAKRRASLAQSKRLAAGGCCI